jgi:deazaflavin-dependent oxidoreductase (nitroreductase family)
VSKRRLSKFLSVRVFNPLVKTAARLGIPLPWVVILETTGRRTGRPRRTPVGKALVGETLWIVAEHGRRAGYVRNIEANPRVRVRLGRRWRTGSARTLPEDDPRERQRRIPNKANSVFVRAMGSELLTVRIDLDPADPRPSAGSSAAPGPGSPRSE